MPALLPRCSHSLSPLSPCVVASHNLRRPRLHPPSSLSPCAITEFLPLSTNQTVFLVFDLTPILGLSFKASALPSFCIYSQPLLAVIN